MSRSRGQLSLQILLVGFVTSIVLSGLVIWVDSHIRSVNRAELNSLAFGIAESGIEYYRWHLAHDPTDFQDGTGQTGPYTHSYYDKNDNKIGEFELEITAPATGSNIITIQSTGLIESNASIKKIIEVEIAPPSLARFSVLSNSDVLFGPGTEVYGQIHSNGGIRFDGLAHNLVTSAKEEYNDPDHSGNVEFGVHTHISPVDPYPPTSTPVRTDIFEVGRRFPVPAIDFTGLTQNLANIKTAAIANGYYIGASGANGYHIVLKTNDTFDIYKVTALLKGPPGCPVSQKNWGTWSIQTETLVTSGVSFPSNQLIFVEDDLWIDGQIDGARLTIAVGRFPDNPAKRKSIIANNDLTYTNYDGQDILGLIAQEDFNVGLKSDDNLKIDAAVVAQNGRIGRNYYKSKCGSEYKRSTIDLYGMIASNQRYGFAYMDGTGYATRTITYDGNMLYSPPPSFPTTGQALEIISWKELK